MLGRGGTAGREAAGDGAGRGGIPEGREDSTGAEGAAAGAENAGRADGMAAGGAGGMSDAAGGEGTDGAAGAEGAGALPPAALPPEDGTVRERVSSDTRRGSRARFRSSSSSAAEGSRLVSTCRWLSSTICQAAWM